MPLYFLQRAVRSWACIDNGKNNVPAANKPLYGDLGAVGLFKALSLDTAVPYRRSNRI